MMANTLRLFKSAAFGLQGRSLICRAPQVQRSLCISRLQAAQHVVLAAAVEEADEGEMEWDADMPVPVKRRIRALREVQARFDDTVRLYQQERASLEAKYVGIYSPLLDERKDIVAKVKDVGTFDIADDGTPDEGIPEFWLTAIVNHDLVGGEITDRDAEVLKHLQDVRYEVAQQDGKTGFKLIFTFAPNPYLKQEVLEKLYLLDDPDLMIPYKFTGTKITWAAGKNPTVQVVKKKVPDRKKGGKGGAPALSVTKTEPCASFFNFFNPPLVPENPDDLDEEVLDKLQEDIDKDYELGLAFKEQIIHRAVEWYTGEAASALDFDEDEYGEYGEYDDLDDEPEQLQQPQQRLPPPRR